MEFDPTAFENLDFSSYSYEQEEEATESIDHRFLQKTATVFVVDCAFELKRQLPQRLFEVPQIIDDEKSCPDFSQSSRIKVPSISPWQVSNKT